MDQDSHEEIDHIRVVAGANMFACMPQAYVSITG